jgi:hypothetical protein
VIAGTFTSTHDAEYVDEGGNVVSGRGDIEKLLVVDADDTVYFNGQPEGSTAQYQRQAVTLANPQNPPPPPAPNQGWTPLGVWALCQEEKRDADMFVQLSVNKTGQISGAYTHPHPYV